MLCALASGQRDHSGRPYVMTSLDEFVITGPNGHHKCIASEPLGCSVADSKYETIP